MSRAMKDSGIAWIGEIPEEWRILALKYLCTMQAGKNLISEKITEEGLFSVYGGNGQRGYYCEYNCEGAKLVVGRQGALCGNVHKVDGRIWATEHAVITDATALVTQDFLYYLLIGMNLNQYASSTAAQPGLAVSTIQNVRTCLPSLSEQEKIARFLDSECARIDAVIEQTRASIEEYKKLKQAVITQAVTKGIRPNRPMKDSRVDWLEKIDVDWNNIKLKSVIKAIESGTSVNASQYPAVNDEIGVLKTSCVSKYSFIPSENKAVNKDELDRVSCPVKANTIIMSRMNTPDLVGACGFVTNDIPNLYLPDRLWQISFVDGVNVKYFWYYLNSNQVRNHYSSLAVGTSSSMQNISQDQLYNTCAPLPSKEEQDEIVSYLDARLVSINYLISTKEKLLKVIESYRKALIFEYVTGKKEVE